MNNKDYNEWRKADPISRKAVFLQGSLDPIIIMAVPTGKPADRFIEGFDIKSETAQFPVGYVSFAWCSEHFEFVDGTIHFESQSLTVGL